MTEKLTIEFKTKEQMEQFARWLCDSGEQEYWEYMVGSYEHDKYMNEKYPGLISSPRTKENTVEQFNYHGSDDKGQFLEDNIIRTK